MLEAASKKKHIVWDYHLHSWLGRYPVGTASTQAPSTEIPTLRNQSLEMWWRWEGDWVFCHQESYSASLSQADQIPQNPWNGIVPIKGRTWWCCRGDAPWELGGSLPGCPGCQHIRVQVEVSGCTQPPWTAWRCKANPGGWGDKW